MKVLIVFNHPAPYKVRMFNELSKYVDLTVLFERNKARDRNDSFYCDNNYMFKAITFKKGYIGNEGSYSRQIKNYIKNNYKDYDFIIMNGISHLAEIFAIRYMQSKSIPYSILINGGIAKEKESPLRKYVKTSMIKNASFWISPSLKSDEYLVHYGAVKEKIYRYPYSNISNADLKQLNSKNEIRKKYSLPLDKKIFINSSQFIDRKNNLSLLEHFKNTDNFLLLIGEGPEQHQYEEFIKTNKLTNVKIIPFLKRNELFEIMQGCDAFITLAKKDIFGQTTLEALANGLPVISSKNVNSSLEYVVDGYNGYLVDLNNPSSIDEAIQKSYKISCKNAINSVKSVTFEECGKRIFDILKNNK